MITVKVDQVERQWKRVDSIEEGWIAQHITRLKHEEWLCVWVGTEMSGVRVGLRAGKCAPSQGSGRPPNKDERRVLELWNDLVKRNERVDSGHVIALSQAAPHYLVPSTRSKRKTILYPLRTSTYVRGKIPGVRTPGVPGAGEFGAKR